MKNASLRLAVKAKRKPLAGTLSLVFGGLAFLTVWIPLVSLLSWFFAALGLVFGFFALRGDTRSRTAQSGVGLSMLGLLGCLAWIFVFNASFTVHPARPGEHGVTYSSQKDQSTKLL